MITDKELKKAHCRFKVREIKYFLVWFFGFLLGLVILAHILKHVFKVKIQFWLLNDTADGDYPPEWFIKLANEKRGLEAYMTLFGLFKMKQGLYAAFWWWWRNRAWNFYNLTKPDWDNGRVDIINGVEQFWVIKLTIPYEQMFQNNRYNRFTKASKDKKIYGINYYCYRLNGKVYFNFSKATEDQERQLGAGGNEWRNWNKY